MNFWAVITIVVYVSAFNVGESEEATFKECGGTVRISTTEETVISYKEDENYSNYERCLWALIPEDPSVVFANISVQVQKGTFDYSDGLQFYSWTDSGIFEGTRLYTFNEPVITFETSQGFLFFTSDYSSTTNGFRIVVSGVVSELPSKVDERIVLSFTEGNSNQSSCGGASQTSPVTISYPEFPLTSYKDNTKLAIVFQVNRALPWSTRNTTINYLDTEQGIDVVEVIALRPYDYHEDTHYKQGTYTGHHPEGFATTESYESTIVLFRSDHVVNGRGFQVTWSWP